MGRVLGQKKVPEAALKALRRFLVLVFMTLPLDQGTKFWSRQEFLVYEDASDTTLYQGRRQEILAWEYGESGLSMQLTYVRNHGASWGFLRGIPDIARVPLLVVFGLLFGCGIGIAAASLAAGGQGRLSMALLIMLAGAVGNGVDRLCFGYVVDFISLKWRIFGQSMSLPVFNIADIIIALSLISVIYQMLVDQCSGHKEIPKFPT